MYKEYIALALAVQVIATQFKSNPGSDSLQHYNKVVGYYKGLERYAIKADSVKLVKLTPSLADYERNAMSKARRWYLTENYETIIKRPIPKYRSTFLNPVKQ